MTSRIRPISWLFSPSDSARAAIESTRVGDRVHRVDARLHRACGPRRRDAASRRRTARPPPRSPRSALRSPPAPRSSRSSRSRPRTAAWPRRRAPRRSRAARRPRRRSARRRCGSGRPGCAGWSACRRRRRTAARAPRGRRRSAPAAPRGRLRRPCDSTFDRSPTRAWSSSRSARAIARIAQIDCDSAPLNQASAGKTGSTSTSHATVDESTTVRDQRRGDQARRRSTTPSRTLCHCLNVVAANSSAGR